MAGAKRSISTSTFASGEFEANLSLNSQGAPFSYIALVEAFMENLAVSCVGASVSLSPISSGWVSGTTGVVVHDGVSGSDITAAVMAWWGSAGSGHTGGCFVCWAATAAIPGSSARQLKVNGYIWSPGPPVQTYSWLGPTTWTVNWSFGATNLFTRSLVTSYAPGDYASILDVRQRSEVEQWCGNSGTTVTATCGSATATGNMGLGSGETDGLEPNRITLGLADNAEPATDTAYGTITLSSWFGGSPDLSIYNNMYQASGHSGWYFAANGTNIPAPNTPPAVPSPYQFKVNASGGSISLVRGSAGTSGPISWSGGPLISHVDFFLDLQKMQGEGSPGWSDYGEGDTSQGHAFDINRTAQYHSDGTLQTSDETSVGPGTHQFSWINPNDNSIPYTLWSVLDSPTQLRVNLRQRWLQANGEDVPFTNPLTNDAATGDIRQAIAIPPLPATSSSANPFVQDWLTVTRTELNLDLPDGANQPSPFAGVGDVTVSGTTWTLPAAGGTVSRQLANARRVNRLHRLGAGQWPNPVISAGPPIVACEISELWLYMTKANLPISVTGDDPNWWDPNATPHAGELPGILYEDITDWGGIGCMELSFTGATEDIPVSLNITYRYIASSSCQRYTSAGAKWSGDDAWEVTLSSPQTYTVTSVDGIDHTTGIAKFDLVPDSGAALPKLYLVDKVEFVFGVTTAAQTLNLTGWQTVPYDNAHQLNVLVQRVAHLYMSDYFGTRLSLDGGPNYCPAYCYNSERAEVGFKNIYPLLHDPDSEATSILTYLKQLSSLADEWSLVEHPIRPTWNQSNVNRDLSDPDSVVLATPMCGDFDSIAEQGFAIHVGATNASTIRTRTILQGGARGIAKSGGVRTVNAADAVTLLKSTDGGATTTTVGSFPTGNCGEWIAGPGQEKAPATYYLQTGTGRLSSIGSFVNEEIAWATVVGGYYGKMWQRFNGQTLMARVDQTSGHVYVVQSPPSDDLPWVNEGTVFSGSGWSYPTIVERSDGSWVVTAMDSSNRTHIAINRMHDQTDAQWIEVTSP